MAQRQHEKPEGPEPLGMHHHTQDPALNWNKLLSALLNFHKTSVAFSSCYIPYNFF